MKTIQTICGFTISPHTNNLTVTYIQNKLLNTLYTLFHKHDTPQKATKSRKQQNNSEGLMLIKLNGTTIA